MPVITKIGCSSRMRSSSLSRESMVCMARHGFGQVQKRAVRHGLLDIGEQVALGPAVALHNKEVRPPARKDLGVELTDDSLPFGQVVGGGRDEGKLDVRVGLLIVHQLFIDRVMGRRVGILRRQVYAQHDRLHGLLPLGPAGCFARRRFHTARTGGTA